MNLKGLHKTSLIDFPGKISTILFTGGCNFSCHYCHNPELAANAPSLPIISNADAINFINKRRHLIDGVTISGGEPTLATNLIPFLKEIKEMDLAIKLDSNGSKPDIIKTLIDNSLVNYFAIDMKTSPSRYKELTDSKIEFSSVIQSINLIKESGLDYEIRTTCYPLFVSLNEMEEIKKSLIKVKRYYLQQYHNSVTINPESKKVKPYSIEQLIELQQFADTFAEYTAIRGI